MKDPMVSICCLSYNHKPFIAQTLEGFLSQKCNFKFEVLIHDDASTDGTQEIIKEYASKYPDIIKPVYETENQFSKKIKNISGLFNFPRASGKYIAMCEGDDYWISPHKLSKQVEYMESHPECSICFHSAVQESDGVVLKKGLMRPYKSTCRISPIEIIDKNCGYPTASLLFRTDIMKKLPKFYMEAPIGDIPMQLLMSVAGEGYYIDEPMACYRFLSAGSWSSEMLTGNFKNKQLKYCDDMLKMYSDFKEYLTENFSEPDFCFDKKPSINEYLKATDIASERLFYKIRVNIRDWETIFSKKYKAYLNELGIFENIMLRFERYFPALYRFIRKTFIK